MDSLPELRPFPTVATRILKACDNPQVEINEIRKIIQCDPSIVVSLLKTANSASFSITKEVITIDEAVVVLGFRAVRNLVVGIATEQMFDNNATADMALWQHSLGCASIAKLLARETNRTPDEAFLAGILHDIGKLLFFDFIGAEYQKLTSGAKSTEILQIEQTRFGTTHQELGQRCAEEWGLPLDISDAIYRHHEPETVEDSPLVGIICVANCLARHWGISCDPSEEDVTEILGRANLAYSQDFLDELKELAFEEYTAVNSVFG